MATYNNVTRLNAHGGNVTPDLRRVAAQPDAGVGIGIADTTIMTLPAIEACGNPVLVQACINLAVGGNSIATFKLFRSDDGGATFTEINSDNRYVQAALAASGEKVVHMLWYDQPLKTTVLAMAPIYRLVAIATVVGLTAGVASTMVAHT